MLGKKVGPFRRRRAGGRARTASSRLAPALQHREALRGPGQVPADGGAQQRAEACGAGGSTAAKRRREAAELWRQHWSTQS